MPDKVKCAGCGYLGLRSKTTRQLVDAEDCFRRSGYIPEIALDKNKSVWAYEDVPICFVGEAEFFDEITKH